MGEGDRDVPRGGGAFVGDVLELDPSPVDRGRRLGADPGDEVEIEAAVGPASAVAAEQDQANALATGGEGCDHLDSHGTQVRNRELALGPGGEVQDVLLAECLVGIAGEGRLVGSRLPEDMGEARAPVPAQEEAPTARPDALIEDLCEEHDDRVLVRGVAHLAREACPMPGEGLEARSEGRLEELRHPPPQRLEDQRTEERDSEKGRRVRGGQRESRAPGEGPENGRDGERRDAQVEGASDGMADVESEIEEVVAADCQADGERHRGGRGPEIEDTDVSLSEALEGEEGEDREDGQERRAVGDDSAPGPLEGRGRLPHRERAGRNQNDPAEARQEHEHEHEGGPGQRLVAERDPAETEEEGTREVRDPAHDRVVDGDRAVPGKAQSEMEERRGAEGECREGSEGQRRRLAAGEEADEEDREGGVEAGQGASRTGVGPPDHGEGEGEEEGCRGGRPEKAGGALPSIGGADRELDPSLTTPAPDVEEDGPFGGGDRASERGQVVDRRRAPGVADAPNDVIGLQRAVRADRRR